MRGFALPAWFAAAIATFGLVLGLHAATPAAADDGARAFTQTLIDKGFTILRGGADKTARVKNFDAFIVQHMDARKTALFTLGHYRRGAPDGVVEPFVAAFTDYSTAIYGAHLVDFAQATLRVTGDVVNKPGDVTVSTLAEGGGLRAPLRIAFRLAAAGGTYKIIDVQVEGIWLSVEQREQFASALAQSRGDITSLTASLKDRTARLRGG